MTATAAPARARRARAGQLLLLCFLASAVGLGALAQGTGGYFVPGDPKAGMAAFFDKGCARCHAVLGEGGQSAPDLARAPAGHLSAAGLVAAMWNHAPPMWEKMRQGKGTPPAVTAAGMAHLVGLPSPAR